MLNEQSIATLSRKLTRELGDVVNKALDDPLVVEVMLNPDGTLWDDRLGKGMRQIGAMTPAQADNLMSTIATLADTEVNKERPILECTLPMRGERFEGLLPPVVDAPTFTIRKKALQIFTLDQYVENGIMAVDIANELREAVARRENVLVVGGTGSGKTTLGNALLDHLGQIAGVDQRVVIIEEVAELQCSAPNNVFLRTSHSTTANDLLRATMRLRPDRIVVGEVRGAEALTLLKSWNTGHPGGFCTIHANSPEGALIRLDQLCQEAGVPPQKELIQEAVDAIVFIKKVGGGRVVERLWRPKECTCTT